MKGKSETRPIDVSKGLFMDLAFLLIAALVLLVREPAREKPTETLPSPPFVNVRVASQQAKEIEVDPSLPGQTLAVEVTKDGTLYQISLDDDHRTVLKADELKERLEAIATPRTVMIRADREVPYEVVAQLREVLADLQARGEIKQLVESVVHEDAGK